nr:hypothetical protein [Tanacetum cinerariifolium]
MSSSTVTYTSISFDSDLPPWGFHLMDPDEFEAPLSLEQAPPSSDYVPGPEYLEYVAPSDNEIPVEDQPLPADASPTALSPGYDEDEEEHLALADSNVLPAIDPVPLAEETKPFKTNESTATPPPPQTIVPVLIAEYASALIPPSPTPSPLSPLSSPLPKILSPPLLLPYLHTSPTYISASMGYRAAMVQLRAALPSTYHPLHVPSPHLLLPSAAHRTDIPEAKMPPQKRACFTAPVSRVDYGFIDTLDASIRVSRGRVMTTVKEAWSRSEDRRIALEALIRAQEARTTTLEAQVGTPHIQHDKMEWQRQDACDLVASTFGDVRDDGEHLVLLNAWESNCWCSKIDLLLIAFYT